LVKDILEELPEAYDPSTWERKAEIVFNHIFASFYDDGGSAYEEGAVVVLPDAGPSPAATVDVETITSTVVEQIRRDPVFAESVAEKLRGDKAFFAIPSEELIAGDETFEVEFKSTARWNLREQRKDKRMEDAVVKTVAGFLNTDGGTLLIGVSDERQPIGLSHDVVLVKPASADGLVNWLTTHLVAALRHPAVMRTRMRIDQVDSVEICRVDVARSSAPVRARMSDGSEVFWVRMNNSTRSLPEEQADEYVSDRWA
jgi:type I restriction enzyme R subunit